MNQSVTYNSRAAAAAAAVERDELIREAPSLEEMTWLEQSFISSASRFSGLCWEMAVCFSQFSVFTALCPGLIVILKCCEWAGGVVQLGQRSRGTRWTILTSSLEARLGPSHRLEFACADSEGCSWKQLLGRSVCWSHFDVSAAIS